ncbi:HotDog domain-containing protein [Xylariaceae sp. FL1272]|nr:HotDog domain-containing protein [Xylariaceae sp. FL1272]
MPSPSARQQALALPRLSDHSATSFRSLVFSHPAVTDFRQRRAVREFQNPLQFNEDDIPNSLTCTTLAGLSTIPKERYVFTDDETGSLIAFYHLGNKLAGHSKMVHGGIAGVLLDECMGRACFPRLAGRIGVTAKLELEYRYPIPVQTDVLIRADTTEIQGRKAWVAGSIEDACSGVLLVKATALFVEPKFAADMPKVI